MILKKAHFFLALAVSFSPSLLLGMTQYRNGDGWSFTPPLSAQAEVELWAQGRNSGNSRSNDDPGCCENIKQAWDSASLPVRIAVITIPSILVAGGAFLLYRLITREESSEKIYMKARFLYNELADKYNRSPFIRVKNITTSLSEKSLEKLATEEDMLRFMGVSSDYARLRAGTELLEQRVVRDGRKGSLIIRQMSDLVKEIKQLLANFEKYEDFWNNYGSYFMTYNTTSAIANRYKQIRQKSTNRDFVKSVIMTMAVGGSTQYPYLTFADVLKDKVNELNRSLRTVQQYQALYNTTQQLHDELHGLLGMIVTFPEYANELYLKKQHQLEQERLNIEHQKAEAEQAKAQAMAQQAAAERDKVHAMYAQAAAEREKAQAIKEQNLIQLAQPKPQPQVTVNIQAPMQAAQPAQVVVPNNPPPVNPEWFHEVVNGGANLQPDPSNVYPSAPPL